MTETRKGYVLVEGHGEVQAVGNLISRLSADLGIAFPWATPIRWKGLHQRDRFVRGANFIRSKPDAQLLLILRDEDDACPKERGPEMASWLRALALPFPSAVVLFHPEYEVLFLPCLHRMSGERLDGRSGLEPETVWDGESWEAKRGIKEWLTDRFPPNRSYKPPLDQLPMTRMIDFGLLRDAAVPCFQTLERALSFLDRSPGTSDVYPT